MPSLTEFVLDCQLNGLSISTARVYARLIQRFQEDHPGRVPESFQHQDIAAYLERLMTTPARNKKTVRQASSVEVYRKSLSRWFGWLQMRGYTSRNPCEHITFIKHRSRILTPPAPDRVKQLLSAAKAHKVPEQSARDYAILAFAVDTGARLGEILKLNISDIFDGPSLRPTVTLAGKGSRDRLVALNAPVQDALIRYMALRRASPSEPGLFVDQKGRRLSRVAAKMLLWRVCDRAGVSRLGWHQFRRFAATQMSLDGVQDSTGRLVLGMSQRMWEHYTVTASSLRAVEAHRQHSPLLKLA